MVTQVWHLAYSYGLDLVIFLFTYDFVFCAVFHVSLCCYLPQPPGVSTVTPCSLSSLLCVLRTFILSLRTFSMVCLLVSENWTVLGSWIIVCSSLNNFCDIDVISEMSRLWRKLKTLHRLSCCYQLPIVNINFWNQTPLFQLWTLSLFIQSSIIFLVSFITFIPKS